MKTAFLLVALLGTGTFVRAEDVGPADFYVQAGRFKQRYHRAPGVGEGDIENGVIHADQRRGKHRYLLVSYTERSRPQNPMGRCGGGVESWLVWIDVVGTTVVASQSAHYESCWSSIEGGKPTWAETHFSVRYEQTGLAADRMEGVTVTRSMATFDTQAPEKGLEIISQPPEKQKP